MTEQTRSARRKMRSKCTVISWLSLPPIVVISSLLLLNASGSMYSHCFSAEAFSSVTGIGNFGKRFAFTGSPLLLSPATYSRAKNYGDYRWYLASSTDSNHASSENESSPKRRTHPSSLQDSISTDLQIYSSSPLQKKPIRKRDTVGGYDASERIGEGINVGDPQIKVEEKEFSVTSILRELAAIQQKGPQKYCILGTRHCSYLHQQIIELL